jgi:hypothetical protein
VRELKADGSLPSDTKLRSSKYLNKLIEQDQRGVKQRIAVMFGFKGFRHAAITIGGIELMPRIRKGQFRLGHLDVKVEPRLLFGTPCWELEVSTPHQGCVCPAVYLHPNRNDMCNGSEDPGQNTQLGGRGPENLRLRTKPRHKHSTLLRRYFVKLANGTISCGIDLNQQSSLPCDPGSPDRYLFTNPFLRAETSRQECSAGSDALAAEHRCSHSGLAISTRSSGRMNSMTSKLGD